MAKIRIFDDILILNDDLKRALETTRLTSPIDFYDSYRLLCETILKCEEFQNGHFKNSINLAIYQETESFPSPKSKWKYFTQKELKIFNDILLKYIRSTYYITFETPQKFRIKLGRFSGFIPNNEYDNKIKLSKNGNNLVYETFIAKDSSSVDCLSDHFKCPEKKLITFYILDYKLRLKFIKKLEKLYSSLREFKKYVDIYLLENLSVNDLLCNDKKS